MATLESDERNIVEADAVNWRMVVYPLVAAVVVLLGGFGIYYYQLNQRDLAETQAREALVQAKSPEEMVKVADQFPDTTQSAVALLAAGDALFAKKDYENALKDYRRAATAKDTPAQLRDSAQLGLGSAQEAMGQADDAIQTYLAVAHQGNRSPFAPVAYHAVAQIYAGRQDKVNEQKILQQAAQLGGDSPFVREAATRLQTPDAAAPAGGVSPPPRPNAP